MGVINRFNTSSHAKALENGPGKVVYFTINRRREIVNTIHQHTEKERTEYNPLLNTQLSSNTNCDVEEK